MRSGTRMLGLMAVLFGLFGASLVAQGAELFDLIKNSSLEAADTNGDPANWHRGGYGANTRSFTTTSGESGAIAAKVEITAWENGDAKWYFDDVPVTPGNVHTLQHAYRSHIPSKLIARYETKEGYRYDLLGTLPPSLEWTHSERSIVIPKDATALTIFHAIDSVGSLEIDSFKLTPGSPSPAEVSGNLVANPLFAATNGGTEPAGWHRGGYGANTPTYRVKPCRYYAQSELPYSADDARFGFAYRPDCPPDTLSALTVLVSDHRDGDAKWYFTDVAVGENKKFTLSYQFQTYNHRSRAIARYTFVPGVYRYELLGNMIPPPAGGQGYVAWKSATHEFTAPKGATSLTVFFAVGEDDSCNTSCTGSDRGGALSIANVVLNQ